MIKRCLSCIAELQRWSQPREDEQWKHEEGNPNWKINWKVDHWMKSRIAASLPFCPSTFQDRWNAGIFKQLNIELSGKNKEEQNSNNKTALKPLFKRNQINKIRSSSIKSFFSWHLKALSLFQYRRLIYLCMLSHFSCVQLCVTL